jgi:demethylmenaquinone methyltransferase/2-methoxy-6-polyprenyl-1,4-benzoquinol methylase
VRGRRFAVASVRAVMLLRIPVRDAVFDLITVAFGFRNLANYRRAPKRCGACCAPGGMAAILEFSHLRIRSSPRCMDSIPGVCCPPSEAHSPVPGTPTRICRSPYASFRRGGTAAEMRQVGFRSVRFERITAGIVCLHLGEGDPSFLGIRAMTGLRERRISGVVR